MGASLVPTFPNSARELLVQWANEQDGWIRLLVSEVLTSSAGFAESFLDEIYQTFLLEKGLVEGEVEDVSVLSDSGAAADDVESLLLTRLSDLENVNALAAGQAIEFNPKLTIVFGQNACGKTGYVRVLKMAAAVRTAERVLPNVKDTNKTGARPTASLSYRLGDTEASVRWQNESGLVPFTRIDVFDSGATNLHVDGDLNYVYTPAELARFPRVQKGVDGIKTRLESAIAGATKTTNTFTLLFPRGTKVFTLVESLGASTDPSSLQALSVVSQSEREEVEALQTEIDALRSSTPELQVKAATDLKQRVEALGKAFNLLGGIDLEAYTSGLARVKTANEQYDGVTRKSFAGLEVPGILGDAWKQFIQSGEEYLNTIETGEYPSKEANCLYCRQPLSASAVELLKKYRDFCNNTFRADLTEFERRIESMVSPLRTALNFPDLERQLGELLSAVRNLPPTDAETLKSGIATGTRVVAAMTEREPATWTDKESAVAGARDVLKELWDQNGRVLKELTSKKDERDKILKQREARLADIEARLKLSQVLPEIETYVRNAKWADRAKIHLKKFTGLQRSLTETSKVASQKLLNQDFEKLFQTECRLLRAPSVTLQFPGREGQVVRKKAVAADHRPSEVLSEGEQKVTALADFLAEASLKPPAPVIFDDPINSLDYIRMSEVVNRIVSLTAHRQVIVFTHNIWFATELLSRFEERKADCFYYDVSREGDLIGVISKGTHPRSDTVKNLRSRINTMVQGAEKQTGEVRQALVEKGYELLRSLCEVIVETELLAGVTTRYQPNVRMTVLPKIKGEALTAAVEVICPVFEDCCRYIASHSQPLETLNVRPTLDSFKADLKKILDARDAYMNA
jgi:recombinational DNA repair ATPase RecF